MANSTPANRNADEPQNRESRQAETEHQRRNEALERSATTPANGAAVQQAQVGAQLAADGPARDSSETANALKRATGSDKSQA